MVKVISRLFLAWSFWFSFLFSACQPLAETNVPASTNTEANSVISDFSTPTETPEVLLTATLTQGSNDCTVDQKLPSPDIPENYIGWKPSTDLAHLYEEENGKDDFIYWESLLNGNNDFAVAGYRRSDNSYMIFLEKVVCRDTNQERVYEIVDAVRTRILNESEEMAPPNFECYRFEQDGTQEKVFAIVNELSSNAVLAWSIDVQNQHIQETALEAISCFPFGISAPTK